MSFDCGTRNSYTFGCRCNDCCSANREYKKTLSLREVKKHGSLYSYTDLKCRCDLCRLANSEYSKAYKKKKKNNF